MTIGCELLGGGYCGLEPGVDAVDDRLLVLDLLLDDVAGKAMRFELAESGWKTTDVPVPANGVVKIAGSAPLADRTGKLLPM